MMRLALAFVVIAQALAAAPDVSLRPVARADQPVQLAAADLPADVTLAQIRPVARRVAAAPQSLRPSLRPKGLELRAMARRRERLKGSICGDPDIQGTAVGAVPGRIRGCGISEGVRIRSVAGVALSQEAVIDCGTAKALKTWVANSAKPQLKSFGGGLSRLRVAAHYACRTRNNQPGAKLSEHSKGKAIDISGFIMKDGSEITVLNGWNGRTSRALRAMHKGACGPFGTVLGPNSDRFHRDHFHFDTARYRSGSYCR